MANQTLDIVSTCNSMFRFGVGTYAFLFAYLPSRNVDSCF